MGAEQSNVVQGAHASRSSRIGQLRRGKSVPESKRRSSSHEEQGSSRSGSCSPGQSGCSDSELPYVSYTVNRPIGDSPKAPVKHSHLARGKSLGNAVSILSSPGKKGVLRRIAAHRTHNIVVVKPAAKEESVEQDPDILKLLEIPSFLPIVRGSINHSTSRDPEILERLDPAPLTSLCMRCQLHLNECATLVAADQNLLANRLKDIDTETCNIVSALSDRFKACQKYTDSFTKVPELTVQINKCHLALNKTLEMIEMLNNLLPLDDRLEPFVWTTG